MQGSPPGRTPGRRVVSPFQNQKWGDEAPRNWRACEGKKEERIFSSETRVFFEGLFITNTGSSGRRIRFGFVSVERIPCGYDVLREGAETAVKIGPLGNLFVITAYLA